MKSSQDPSWVFSFLSMKFFNACILHEYYKKNEKNIFCLNCSTSICVHCIHFHNSHHLLQVRRYAYEDVVRLEDLEKLFDCGYVQSYTSNNAKVVFLKQRPQTRPLKSTGSSCHACYRVVQKAYHFCSFSCKVQHLVAYEGCISRYMCDWKCLNEEDRQMTPNSVLDGELMTTSSGETSVEYLTVGCTTSSLTITRKKRSSRVAVAMGRVHRRKGVCVRSPLQ